MKREFVWIAIITCIFFVYTYLPTYLNYTRAPEGRLFYAMNDEYPIDTTWNLGLIRQGYNGHTDSFLNISSTFGNTQTYLKFDYIFIGLVARIVQWDPLTAFLVFRFLVSLAYIVGVYWIIRRVFPRSLTRILAYLLVLFGSGIAVGPGKTFIETTVMDSLITHRMTGAGIHYMLGGLLTMLSVFFLSRVLDLPHRRFAFIIASLTGMGAAFVNAPSILLHVLSLPVYLFVVFFRKDSRHRTKEQFFILIAYCLLLLVPIFYVRQSMTTVWGPYAFAHTEELNPFHLTFIQYLSTVGLPYVLSVLAIPFIYKKGNTFLMLLAPWVIIHPVGEYVLPQVLDINPIRIFLTPYFVGFGLLAAAFVSMLAKKNWIMFVLMFFVFASSWTAYTASFKRAQICFCNGEMFSYGYPRRDLIEVLTWLSKNSKEQDVVLSGLYSGNMIPAFAGNVVYTSWWHRLMETPGFWEVKGAMEFFFSGTMGTQHAEKFVAENHIRWVLYFPPEHATIFDAGKYPFLKEEYRKNDIVVYKVR